MATFKEALEYAANNPNSDFAKQFGAEVATGKHDQEAASFGFNTAPIKEKFAQPVITQQQKGEIGVKGVATGIGKGILSTVKGAGQLGATIGQKALGSVGVNVPNLYSDEATKGGLLDTENLQAQGTAEKIGKFGEQVAEFAIPASKVSKLTKGSNFIGRVAPRAVTSGTTATVQEGGIGKETGIAAGVETVLPVAGKILTPAARIISRLFKGLGSGLSGVGTDTIDQISKNPEIASRIANEITKSGNSSVLKTNTKSIIDGISNIRKEARKAYGTGLDVLKSTDIDNKIFKDSLKNTLDKYGSIIKNGERKLTNVEFSDPKNLKTAKELVSKLQGVKLDGKSLRKLADDIESKMYKVATSDERLSFNAFVKDLAGSLKKAISGSTNKLDEINKAFSQDIQLAQSIEDIFGKTKFKNASEINKVANKLETLFSKKGLTPEYINKFLTRIGIKPEDFKTSEAVRQITNKSTGANTKGLSIGEITQQVTSSVVTPKMVRDIAIFTGKSEELIKNVLENVAPAIRGSIIKLLIPEK